jgi:RNA recognition motif-containing protein
MESKLYVGNLPYSTSADDLRNLFSQAGTVVSADVIMDRMSGQSKGFAFVQMETPAEAEKAISMFNGYKMGNRELKVNLARPKEDTGRGGFGGPRGGSGGYNRGGGGGRDRDGGSRRF